MFKQLCTSAKKGRTSKARGVLGKSKCVCVCVCGGGGGGGYACVCIWEEEKDEKTCEMDKF